MTDVPTVTATALLVHVFLDADAAAMPNTPAGTCLAALWEATGSQLGMTSGVAGGRAELDVAAPAAPATSFTLRTRVLGMRENPAASGIEQAVAFRHHDVVGVSVMLAPDEGSWTQLDQRWRDAVDSVPLGAAFGTAQLHLGLVDDVPADAAGRTALAEALRTRVPEPRAGHWPPCWSGSRRRGTTLWELPWRDAVTVATDRRLLALAPRARETDLDHWLWTDGTPLVAPLTRYLLHAAKIRHVHTVLAADLPRLRGFADRLDETRGHVQGAAAALADRPTPDTGRPHPTRSAQLRVAASGAAHLAAMGAEFTLSRDRLDAAVQAVRFAAANARTATRDVRSQPGAPVADDALLAAVTVTQAEAESHTLRGLADAVDRTAQLAAHTVDILLRDRQAQLSLAQTAVVGGLLMVLAAVQAFDYDVPVPGPVQAPLIALLGGLALALPLALPRWRLGAADRAAPPSALVDVTTWCVGAAAGWLAASLVAAIVRGVAAPVWCSAAAAAAGAVVVAVIGAVVQRRATRSPPETGPPGGSHAATKT